MGLRDQTRRVPVPRCPSAQARARVLRGGHNWSKQLPAIAEALLALRVRSVVLDGEGVICGPDGQSDFDAMRACFSRNGAPEALVYAFDVLELDGRDMRTELHGRAAATLWRGSWPTTTSASDFASISRMWTTLWCLGRRASWGQRAFCREWIKIKNPAHPAIERAMLIALSKRVRR